MSSRQQDGAAIDELIEAFFRAFDNRDRNSPALEKLHELFIPDALITQTCGAEPASVSVSVFIDPRRALLSSGEVTDFCEAEIWSRTTIIGDVAHRLAAYEKSWLQAARRREGRGIKSFQLVRTSAGWRISSLAWDDERDGVVVPATEAELDAGQAV